MMTEIIPAYMGTSVARANSMKDSVNSIMIFAALTLVSDNVYGTSRIARSLNQTFVGESGGSCQL